MGDLAFCTSIACSFAPRKAPSNTSASYSWILRSREKHRMEKEVVWVPLGFKRDGMVAVATAGCVSRGQQCSRILSELRPSARSSPSPA